MTTDDTAMSKPLEQMTTKELSQYMIANKNSDTEWQKAYDLFVQKSDWQEVPENATPEEEWKIIEQFIAQTLG